MKKSIFLLSLLMISSAFSANLRTVKVANGQSAYCNNSVDAFRNKTGAYRFKAVASQVVDNVLTVEASISFLKCTSKDNSYRFENVGPFQTLKFTIPSRAAQSDEVTVTTKKVTLRSFINGDMKSVIDTEVATRKSRSKIKINVKLTENQVNTINAGGSVKTTIDTFIVKDFVFSRANGKSLRSSSTFGSFRIFVNVSKSTEGFVVARLVQ